MASYILRPTGSIAYPNWYFSGGSGQAGTPSNYAMVNEASPDDTNGLYGLANAGYDYMSLEDMPALPSGLAIHSVGIHFRGFEYMGNAGGTVYCGIKSGSAESAPSFTVGASVAEQSYTWTTDPNTGLAWTESAVNALQAMCYPYFTNGGKGAPSYYGAVSQLWIKVNTGIPTSGVITADAINAEMGRAAGTLITASPHIYMLSKGYYDFNNCKGKRWPSAPGTWQCTWTTGASGHYDTIYATFTMNADRSSSIGHAVYCTSQGWWGSVTCNNVWTVSPVLGKILSTDPYTSHTVTIIDTGSVPYLALYGDSTLISAVYLI